jgi:nitrogenase-associated protein
MTVIHFYEKSGCAGNRKQKALLEAAGHEVRATDLRDVCWSRDRLLLFLKGLPVSAWFNRTAPAVKDGSIVPEVLSENQALPLLQENPLLIRRPLMEANGVRMVGFDAKAVDAWIGLGADIPSGNLEACAHHAHDHGTRAAAVCPDPRAARTP